MSHKKNSLCQNSPACHCHSCIYARNMTEQICQAPNYSLDYRLHFKRYKDLYQLDHETANKTTIAIQEAKLQDLKYFGI